MQLIFAGKWLHPADDGGKRLIQEIFLALARPPALQGHIAFAEDDDMLLAEQLYAGVDVWLNNPRAPLEVRGTSGMKCGGQRCAERLDSRWLVDRGGGTPNEETGWGIHPSNLPDGAGDQADAEAIYNILETEVVPLFYERDEHDLPRKWIARSKRCDPHAKAAGSPRSAW